MKNRSLITQRKLIAFASVVEASTGLALMIGPSLVIKLLAGAEASGVTALLGRCLCIGLLALGVACWPSGQRTERNSPGLKSMLIYNMLIALYFAYLGAAGQMTGALLWPAATLHAVVALLLIWAWHSERQTRNV